MVPFLFAEIIFYCHILNHPLLRARLTMIFSLAIYSAPYSSQASDSAYRFTQAAIKMNHSIYRVFFYHDGIHHGSALTTPPQDEQNFSELWANLAKQHNIDLVVCIAAALKRGLLNQQEANRYNRDSANLAPGFTISGLGQLLDAAVTSDRLITFGN